MGVPIVKSKNSAPSSAWASTCPTPLCTCSTKIRRHEPPTQDVRHAAFFQQATTKVSWVRGYDYLHESIRHVASARCAGKVGL